MRLIAPLTLTSALILALLLPGAALAGDGHDGCTMENCDHKGHAGPGGGMHHPGMGMGPAPGPAGYPHMMWGHHRGMDAKEIAARANAGDWSWHPNRLRMAAIDFLAADVYRMAILPLNDLSQMGPVASPFDARWTERVVRDTVAGALLEVGLLVLPAENTEAAIYEMKGLEKKRPALHGGIGLFQATANLNNVTDRALTSATREVLLDQLTANSNRAMGHLSALDLDYTPAELRQLADGLDVDGLIIGSVTHMGIDGENAGFLSKITNDERGKLYASMYVIDAATGEPIYGKRFTIDTRKGWMDDRGNIETMDRLAMEFANEVRLDLKHPFPYGMAREMRYKEAKRHEQKDFHLMSPRYQEDDDQRGEHPASRRRGYHQVRRDDANIQEWKQYRRPLDEQIAEEADEEEAASGKRKKKDEEKKDAE